MRKRGTNQRFVYSVPSRKAVQAVKDKVGDETTRATLHRGLGELLASLNRTLGGWANYFRHGVAKATFNATDFFTWRRVAAWVRRKHGRLRGSELRRRFCDRGWRFAADGTVFSGAASVAVTRYRYRGAKIPTPWTLRTPARPADNRQDT